MKRRAFLTLVLAVTGSCDTLPSGTSPSRLSVAAPVLSRDVNVRIPVAGNLLFNPCPPEELVAYEGVVHMHSVMEVTETSTYLRLHSNNQRFHGVGLTSGDRYSLPGNQRLEVFTSVAGPVYEEERDVIFRMLREGSADNLWLRGKMRFKFPPGEVEIIKLEFECRG